jgi:hypothetical protein
MVKRRILNKEVNPIMARSMRQPAPKDKGLSVRYYKGFAYEKVIARTGRIFWRALDRGLKQKVYRTESALKEAVNAWEKKQYGR